MTFKMPEKCPRCGVEDQLVEDKKHIHCKDCGTAFPKTYITKLITDAGKKGK